MTHPRFDAVVVGGGPGGSSAATYLARAGRRVLVLEKERFPRFHIGESLLPYNWTIFEEMGVLPALEAAGFPRKFGAQFHLGNRSKALKFVFRDGIFTRQPQAIQVERSIFDEILLDHTAASGAEVRQGWTVARVISAADGVTVEARDENGVTEIVSAAFLIDASGRSNLTGNQDGLRVLHPRLKKLAVFGHFAGVQLDAGEKAGDTVIVRLANKWCWLIPISKEKISVGCVMDTEEFARAKKTGEQQFDEIVQSSAEMRARMQAAHRLGPIHTTSDFSYYNRRLIGQRLLRVGDAAGFMDPIFSAGVYLAMNSGKLAARAVNESISRGDDGARRLRKYEQRVFAAMKFYRRMAESFYTTPFMEVFLEPRNKFELVSAVNAVLAGELEGGWRLRWRLELFFLLVKLQGRRPFLPRISFD